MWDFSCLFAECPGDLESDDCYRVLLKLFGCGLAIEGANSSWEPFYASSAASIIQNTLKRMSVEERMGSK
jgi:hypothetical protein